MPKGNYFEKYRPLTYKSLDDIWQNILWRERHHCNDDEYAGYLYEAIKDEGHDSMLFPESRPYATEVELALRQGAREQSRIKDIWGQPLDRLYRAKHKPVAPEKLIAKLRYEAWVDRFVARHVLVHRGGEVVEALQQSVNNRPWESKETVVWLLQSIEAETTMRLAQVASNLRCMRCVAMCQLHPVSLSWRPDITFYGCRTCRQSQSFFYCPQGVVAVLDHTWSESHSQQDGLLRVNCLVHRDMFDFDRVEIVQATDEEVERFAMRAGNDTDSVRKPGYEEMQCTVKCELSENTLRILEKIFGQVEQR